MKKQLFLADNTVNRISVIHLCCFLGFLPFDRFYSTIVLLSFLLHSCIHYKKASLKNIGWEFPVLASVFFVSVVSATYAVSFDASVQVITKQLSILLFPILLSITSLNLSKYRSLILQTFSISCTCTVLYLYYDAFRSIQYQQLTASALFSQAFVHHNFSLPIDTHAVYLSMYVVVSMVYLLYEWIEQPRSWMLLCFFILLAGLLQLSSKSVIIAAVIIFLGSFPFFIKVKMARWRYIGIASGICILSLLVIFNTDVYRERFLSSLRSELKSTDLASDNWRIDRWKASFDIVRESPVIGKGTGSEIPLLKEIYFKKKMYVPFLHSMNVHNQFLSFLINSGLVGLLMFIATLVWGFKKAIVHKDIYLLSFLLLTLSVCLAEDMLDVNKGIFFYAFFFSFFIKARHKSMEGNNGATLLL